MVSADRVKPGLVQPLQHLRRLWPTVDQVTHTKQTIDRRIEADRFQAAVQIREAAVNIADREIAAKLIAGEARKSCRVS